MAQPTYLQLSLADATTKKDALQTSIVNASLEGQIQAVQTQINNYAFAAIPIGRVAEFDEGDVDKKNKFMEFSAIANSVKYLGTDFVEAWEAEYTIFYG